MLIPVHPNLRIEDLRRMARGLGLVVAERDGRIYLARATDPGITILNRTDHTARRSA